MEQQQCCTENQRHGLTYYYFSSLFWMEQQPCCANWELKAKATSWLGLTCYFFFFWKRSSVAQSLRGAAAAVDFSSLHFLFFLEKDRAAVLFAIFPGSSCSSSIWFKSLHFFEKKTARPTTHSTCNFQFSRHMQQQNCILDLPWFPRKPGQVEWKSLIQVNSTW